MIRRVLASLTLGLLLAAQPAWRSLPQRPPDGVVANTGAYVIRKGEKTPWQRPPLRYDAAIRPRSHRSYGGREAGLHGRSDAGLQHAQSPQLRGA